MKSYEYDFENDGDLFGSDIDIGDLMDGTLRSVYYETNPIRSLAEFFTEWYATSKSEGGILGFLADVGIAEYITESDFNDIMHGRAFLDTDPDADLGALIQLISPVYISKNRMRMFNKNLSGEGAHRIIHATPAACAALKKIRKEEKLEKKKVAAERRANRTQEEIEWRREYYRIYWRALPQSKKDARAQKQRVKSASMTQQERDAANARRRWLRSLYPPEKKTEVIQKQSDRRRRQRAKMTPEEHAALLANERMYYHNKVAADPIYAMRASTRGTIESHRKRIARFENKILRAGITKNIIYKFTQINNQNMDLYAQHINSNLHGISKIMNMAKAEWDMFIIKYPELSGNWGRVL